MSVTLIGKKARNHPQQVRKHGVDDSIDDRRTPLEIWTPLHHLHRFTIDVAASKENALTPRYFDRQTNGLEQPWAGERVWCNPPYSSIEPWVQKAWHEMHRGCGRVVMLLPNNRAEQGWWQRHVEGFRDRPASRPQDRIQLTTQFLPGRPRFGRPGWDPPPKGDRPPFGLVVLTWIRTGASA